MSGKHWVIVLICIVSSFGIYYGLSDLTVPDKKKWASGSRQILIDKCISDSGDMAKKHHKLTSDYCICSSEKIQGSLAQQQYLALSKRPIEEQLKNLLPLFQDCLTEYQSKIKLLEEGSDRP
jgi:hypothetical protein